MQQLLSIWHFIQQNGLAITALLLILLKWIHSISHAVYDSMVAADAAGLNGSKRFWFILQSVTDFLTVRKAT